MHPDPNEQETEAQEPAHTMFTTMKEFIKKIKDTWLYRQIRHTYIGGFLFLYKGLIMLIFEISMQYLCIG